MCRILIGGIHLVYIVHTETYLPFFLFCKGIAQTSGQPDPELYFSNESHNSNFLNETMGKTGYDAYTGYRYSYAVVNVVAWDSR
jgi:hypothetical protein